MTISPNITQIQIVLVFVCSALFGISQSYNSNYFPPTNYGGKEQLRKIIAHEVNQKEISGRGKAVLKVVINEKGELISKEIFKASADAFGIEALRIIDKVRWHPAYMYGETTEASMLVSIPFSKKYTRKVRELNPVKMNRDANIDLSNFIYTNQQVDTLPKVLYPRGSYTSITNYVLKNFNYPEMAIKYAIQGIVGVEFIIEPRGYVSNVRIYHQLGAGCDVEVAKWINQLYFKPAIKEGKLVRVKMRVEVPIHASKSILQVH